MNAGKLVLRMRGLPRYEIWQHVNLFAARYVRKTGYAEVIAYSRSLPDIICDCEKIMKKVEK